eukprot:6086374-Lingulodinium_polyedra.AAC.1
MALGEPLDAFKVWQWVGVCVCKQFGSGVCVAMRRKFGMCGVANPLRCFIACNTQSLCGACP